MRKYKAPIHLNPNKKKVALKKLHQKWQAHRSQAKILRSIYRDGYRRVFIRAGRKFGKNELANYLCWRTCIECDMAECFIIGKTAEHERKIIWANDRLQSFGPNFGLSVSDTKMILKFPWGSFTQVDGTRNVSDAVGRQYDMCIMDETKHQSVEYFDEAYPNLLAKNGVLVLIGTPPREEETEKHHYFDWEQEAIDSPLWAYHKFTSWENDKLPGGHEWLKAEKARYYARGEKPKWDQEYEVKTVRGDAGVIFPMFRREFHTRPLDVMISEFKKAADKDNVEFYTIHDPGQDVFCVLFCAYNKETSQIYILDEIYETDRYKTSAVPMWEATLAKKKELMPDLPDFKWTDIYDEAASWYEVEVLTRFGHKLTPTHKSRGGSQPGKLHTHISKLKDAMSIPRCFNISERCVQTISEIIGFKDINQRDKNHSIDNLRYFIEESGYEFQSTVDRLVVRKEDLRESRGTTIEQDMAKWQQEEDPYNDITDFEYGFDEMADIFGM